MGVGLVPQASTVTHTFLCVSTKTTERRRDLQNTDSGAWRTPQMALPQNMSPIEDSGIFAVPWKSSKKVCLSQSPLAGTRDRMWVGQGLAWGVGSTHILEASVEGLQLLLGELGLCLQLL